LQPVKLKRCWNAMWPTLRFRDMFCNALHVTSIDPHPSTFSAVKLRHKVHVVFDIALETDLPEVLGMSDVEHSLADFGFSKLF